MGQDGERLENARVGWDQHFSSPRNKAASTDECAAQMKTTGTTLWKQMLLLLFFIPKERGKKLTVRLKMLDLHADDEGFFSLNSIFQMS